MKLIRTEYRNNVAILKLNRGITNALNLQLVSQLAENLQKVRDDPDVHSLVLGSSNDKFFSIGFDILELIELSRKDFKVFYQAFNRVSMKLYTLPKPTVAAITGHAIAGGCILALCCDYRFISEGRRLMGTGEFYHPEELLQMGMVDHVLPLERVLPKSVEKAKLLGSLPQKAFEIIKRNRVEMVEAQIPKRLADKERLFIECWHSDEARERLKEAIKRF